MAVNNTCSSVLFEDQIMPTDHYDHYNHLNFALRLITNFYLSHYALKYWIVKQKITKVYRNHLVLYKNDIRSSSDSDDLFFQPENCHKDLSLQKNDDDRTLLQPFAKYFDIFHFLE